jgi:hypothetical protein
MLADSIVKAVMEADGVDPRELETELRRTAALLRATRRTPKSPDSNDISATADDIFRSEVACRQAAGIGRSLDTVFAVARM